MSDTANKRRFVARYGHVYEHSPWVAELAWESLDEPLSADVESLHAAMSAAMRSAEKDRQLALIRAHPDLADRAAVAEDLTADSRREQAGAGLDRCTREQFERFRALNDAYRRRFGFPFIIAVSGLDRDRILASFEQRLHNAPEQEFATALAQIDRIARLRLEQIAGERAAT